MTIRPAGPADRGQVLALLRDASLPTQDLEDTGAVRFWVAEENGQLAGAIGLERCGEAGLLRSLVVAPTSRNRGVGRQLVAALERTAKGLGIAQLVLLTQAAQPFFARLGFAVIARESVPDHVKATTEFRALCPASAVCMSKSLGANGRAPREPVTRVLFLCTGNSCRSILGEATFNHLAPAGWHAMSAGSQPTGRVHPRSLALLAREGIASEGWYSKSWDDLPQVPDIVVTVCASAAGETCPAYLGPVLRTHWGVDDPARVTGTEEQIDAAFDRAYRTLRRRIEAFLALPLAQLRDDPVRLKVAMDRIGTQVS